MTPENKKKKKFSIRKLIYNDKYLIVSSIIAAIIIWVATSINLSPLTQKKITVPVSVDFSGTLAEQLGIEYFDSTDISVEVTVSCKKYLAKDITADDIVASLQTSSVTSAGYHSVPILVSAVDGAEFTIEKYYPTSAEGYYDVAQETSFPIELKFTNTDFAADGYVSGTTTLSEDEALIRGPQAYVSQISKVVATVDLESGLTQSQLVDLQPKALDKNGREVDYITIKNSVTANVPILKIETLEPKVNFVNAPSNAMSIVNIEYSVDKVEAGVLDTTQITQLILGDIDFSKIKAGENEFTFDVTNLSGILVLDGTESITVKITVPEDFETRNIRVSINDISINAPDGYTASAVSLSSAEITVVGSSESLEAFSNANLVLSCDLKAQSDGTLDTGVSEYRLSVSVKDSTDVWVYGNYTVKVNVRNS